MAIVLHRPGGGPGVRSLRPSEDAEKAPVGHGQGQAEEGQAGVGEGEAPGLLVREETVFGGRARTM